MIKNNMITAKNSLSMKLAVEHQSKSNELFLVGIGLDVHIAGIHHSTAMDILGKE